MKKLFILMVIATITTSSFAQFGVQAGATFASLKAKDNTAGGTTVTTDSKVGFTIGVLMDVPLSTNFMFQPALNYTQKGGKVTDKSGSITDEEKLNFNYLELPLNFIYKASGGFFVGAGPTLAYAISGKDKFSTTGSPIPSQNTSGETKIKFGSDKAADDFKAFEFSGNILAGYELAGGIFFAANYNFGLSNLSLDNTGSLKNRYFGIRLGKKFGDGMMKKK